MRELAELVAKVAELDRKVSGMVRHGRVAEVDTKKHLVRLEVGQGEDGPVLGPWVPYAQQGGALKVHAPPTVGQNMTLISASGDPQQAVALPMTWNDGNASPSQSASENVITFAGTTIRLDQSGISFTRGSVTAKLTNQGVEFTGGTVKHDGRNIGRDHQHGKVEPGSGQTGEPV